MTTPMLPDDVGEGEELPRVVRDDNGRLWIPPRGLARLTMVHADLMRFAEIVSGATFDTFTLADRGWLTRDGRIVQSSEPNS